MTRPRIKHVLYPLAALLLFGSGGVVLGQIESGARGVAPIDDSGSFEVDGVNVDVTAKDSEAARHAGWRLAQRKAWALLSKRLGGGGAMVSDSTLDSIVSAIVVENEQIGPSRYIARLGVTFNRSRAGGLLGIAGGGFRSPPLLVMPIEWTGGVGETFEQRSDWQQAWARFRTGNSSIDYVRPTGTGPDALLLNVGQAGRPGRGWWRTVLDQYGASDVLIPVVRIYRQYPGGPVIGVFEARHGPDDRLIQSFTLRVNSADGLAALLDAGVARIDGAYQGALRSGILRTDPGLAYVPTPTPTPTPIDVVALDALSLESATTGQQGTIIDVQVDTPNAAAVSASEATLRAVPGVNSASTTSLAIGGVSVMRVSFSGVQASLAAALQARGWQVESGAGALRIRRGSPPGASPTGEATAG
ncbi:heavy-metal-associated domain-containing protein [Sphingomonas koreensis]|nr:heavy-metal-associated domain-containing protein [Sphingomonas koreensis]